MTPDRVYETWNRETLDPLSVEVIDAEYCDDDDPWVRAGATPVRARSAAANQAHRPRFDHFAERIDRIANWIAIGTLWLASVYFAAHLLIAAGVRP